MFLFGIYLCLTIDDFPPSNSSFSFLSIIALDAKLAFLIDTCKLREICVIKNYSNKFCLLLPNKICKDSLYSTSALLLKVIKWVVGWFLKVDSGRSKGPISSRKIWWGQIASQKKKFGNGNSRKCSLKAFWHAN